MKATHHPVKNNTHVFVTIACPKLEHVGFIVNEEGRHICDCGADITDEFIRIKDAIEQSVHYKK